MTSPAQRRLWPPGLAPWIERLGNSGAGEALSGTVLLVFAQMVPDEDIANPVVFPLQLGICLGAGMVGRWPRLGTGLVLACLTGMALEPAAFGMPAFAMLIPVVSAGAHGRTALRDLTTILFAALALLITIPLDPSPAAIPQTVFVWSLLFTIAWATGRTVYRLRRENAKQVELRGEALRQQRRSIARDLHDTVAYATTTMIMRAEEMKLRTQDPQSQADLDFIIATGRRSVRDLRGMMEALRRNDPGLDLEPDALWRLSTVADVIQGRVAELAAHGIHLDVSITDPQGDLDPERLDSLPISVRETVAKLIVEATSNMVKHAGEGACQLIIELEPTQVEVMFTNPLRAGAKGDQGTGLGLVGAVERVEAVGGELEASTAANRWILRAQLPLGE